MTTKILKVGVRKAPNSGEVNPNYFPTINGKRICPQSYRRDIALKMAQDAAGFDAQQRWGNSAIVGVGVNSQAMMEARRKFNQAKSGGNWTVQKKFCAYQFFAPHNHLIPIKSDAGGYVAYVSADNFEPKKSDAVARLIAAAPELLAALEVMVEQAVCYMDDGEASEEERRAMDAARSAISRARGEN